MMEPTVSPFRHHDVLYYAADGLRASGGVVHGFSTRRGGVSTGIYSSLNLGPGRGDDPQNVVENFRRFCDALGADHTRVVCARQVHRDDVRRVTIEDAGKGLFAPQDYEADALVTDVPGLPLVIFSADCIPNLFYDPVHRVIAAAHAGWRGTALGIVQKTIEVMRDSYGSHPEDILAAIGPGISRCCFETHADVPNAITAALGQDAAPLIDPLPGGKYRVDLKGINALWMKRAGLLPQHIAISDQCTCCDPQTYWSHRHTGAQRGSLAALIQLL